MIALTEFIKVYPDAVFVVILFSICYKIRIFPGYKKGVILFCGFSVCWVNCGQIVSFRNL